MAQRSEFTLHEVVFESTHFRAVRARTSNGHASISIEGDGIKPRVMFDTDRFGSDYELVAREFTDLLDKATDDPCHLPKATK